MNIEVLNELLGLISSYLFEGSVWHNSSATECRISCARGWGRWHDAEALSDFKMLQSISKISGDTPYLQTNPIIDETIVRQAYTYSIPNTKDKNTGEVKMNIQEFIKHHIYWCSREDKFISILNQAIEESRGIDIKLYKKIMCIQEEVQNEYARVHFVTKRLSLKDWDGHDIGRISQDLHEYFENEYDGGVIDFNIG